MAPEEKKEKKFNLGLIVGGIISPGIITKEIKEPTEFTPLKHIGYPIERMPIYFSDLEELKKERKERKTTDKANQKRWGADNKKFINNKYKGVKPRKR